MYESWALTKDKIVRLNDWGNPKGHPGGEPKGFPVCINIRELEGIKDFFPGRFVRIWCKKNYFLLHKEITSFLLEKALWNFSNVVPWICWMWTISFSVLCPWTVRTFWLFEPMFLYEFSLVYSMNFPLWVMNVVHKQLAIWLFKYR